jgi:hypothetical protein
MEFTFFWFDGKREVGRGINVVKAFTSLGHSQEAWKKIDLFMPGNNFNYEYNKITKSWIRKPTELEALITKMDRGEYVP